jgi:hypothetical protein
VSAARIERACVGDEQRQPAAADPRRTHPFAGQDHALLRDGEVQVADENARDRLAEAHGDVVAVRPQDAAFADLGHEGQREQRRPDRLAAGGIERGDARQRGQARREGLAPARVDEAARVRDLRAARIDAREADEVEVALERGPEPGEEGGAQEQRDPHRDLAAAATNARTARHEPRAFVPDATGGPGGNCSACFQAWPRASCARP